MVGSDKNDPNKRQLPWEYSAEHICEFSAGVARNLAWQMLCNGNVHYHWLFVRSSSNRQSEEGGKGFLLITKCLSTKKAYFFTKTHDILLQCLVFQPNA